MLQKNLINYLLLPAILLRLFFMANFFHPDLKKFHYQVQFLSEGVINVYKYISENKNTLPNTDTFNYFPGNYFILGSWNLVSKIVVGSGLTKWLNDWGPTVYQHPRIGSFMVILKFPYLILDLCVGYLMVLLAKKQKINTDLVLGLWFFNPLSLFAVYAIGQIDIIPTFFTILALWLIDKRNLLFACFLLGLGASIKTYPLLLIPLVLMRVEKPIDLMAVMCSGVAGFIIPMLPVIASSDFISTMSQSNLIQYIFYARVPISGSQYIPIYILILFLTYWWSWQRKTKFDLIPEFLIITFSVILYSHFHAQWIVWCLPFLILYLAKRPKMWQLMITIVISYFIVVILTDDLFLLFGLFSPLNPQMLHFSTPSTLISKFISPNFIQSVFHTVLAATGTYVILKIILNYEKE